MSDISSFADLITICASAAITITTAIVTIISVLKKNKSVKISNAVVLLDEIHAFADECMIDVEKTPYKGADKLQLVLAKCIAKYPTLDIVELTKYVNDAVTWSKQVNFKEVK